MIKGYGNDRDFGMKCTFRFLMDDDIWSIWMVDEAELFEAELFGEHFIDGFAGRWSWMVLWEPKNECNKPKEC